MVKSSKKFSIALNHISIKSEYVELDRNVIIDSNT